MLSCLQRSRLTRLGGVEEAAEVLAVSLNFILELIPHRTGANGSLGRVEMAFLEDVDRGVESGLIRVRRLRPSARSRRA